jgi:uncharacterized protein (TIGR02001 family)
MNKKILLATALLTTAAVPAVSMAETSGNIGWSSEYIFRGVFQEDSSAFAGIDYANDSGFYLGAWTGDVGQGTEIDYYGGFASTIGEDFTWKVGFTAYTYPDDFDDTYQEVNLGVGYGIFALDVDIGEWDGSLFGQPSLDYDFTSITISPEKGPYYKIGLWGGDFEDQWMFPNPKTPAGGDGDFFELGYAYTMEEPAVDLSFALIYSSDLVVGDWDDGETTSDYALVFGLKKSFSIGGE